MSFKSCVIIRVYVLEYKKRLHICDNLIGNDYCLRLSGIRKGKRGSFSKFSSNLESVRMSPEESLGTETPLTRL